MNPLGAASTEGVTLLGDPRALPHEVGEASTSIRRGGIRGNLGSPSQGPPRETARETGAPPSRTRQLRGDRHHHRVVRCNLIAAR
jgi:hypothetical protein